MAKFKVICYYEKIDNQDVYNYKNAVINTEEISSILIKIDFEGYSFIHMKNGDIFKVSGDLDEVAKELGLDCDFSD